MRKIPKSLFLFLFLLFIGFISSCVNDVEIESGKNIVGRSNGALTVDEAKILVESSDLLSLPDLSKNTQVKLQARSAGKLKYDPMSVVPDWTITQEFTEDDMTILMVPLELKTPILGITRTFVDGKENRSAVQIYSKLLVKKNASRQLLGVIVSYLPDHEYWQEDDCNINKLGYELGGTNYSGIYMVSSLDGTMIYGEKFEKGQSVFRFYPNWRKNQCEEDGCQHEDSVGHKDDQNYRLHIDFLDASHNVKTRFVETEGDNAPCIFCGQNPMYCDCFIVDANRICSQCHHEIVNGKCECCPLCHKSPCRCCWTCKKYPCTCWGNKPIYPPAHPPTGPTGPTTGGGGPTGGGGGGGGSVGPPFPPAPRPCYDPANETANPLMEMALMPPSMSNIAGATFGNVRNGGARRHTGIDLKAPVGTPAYALFDGEIVGPYVTGQPNRINTDGEYPDGYSGDDNDAGNRIYIKSKVFGGTVTIAYWHLQAGDPVAKANGRVLRVGDKVKAGQIVAYTGLTGNANLYNKPHVHIGIKSSDGKWIDPKPYFSATITTNTTVIKTKCE